MACNAPLVAWRTKERTPLGKRGVTFDAKEAYIDMPIALPCAKCFGCKLDRAREWAIRCAHEADMHPENSFVTLTYNEENVPKNNGIETLRKRDFVLFMKKLRRKRTSKIAFFQCGEYGELQRPHHHALLFNCGFGDRTLWRKTRNYNIYRSEELESLWDKGHSEIGTVTHESAAYIARYTIKDTTEIKGRVKEYLTMSRNPGLGKTWLEKYMSDVYPSDEVITQSGKQLRPPRYYDEQLRKKDEKLLQKLQQKRFQKIKEENKTDAHRMANEAIKRAQNKLRRKQL